MTNAVCAGGYDLSLKSIQMVVYSRSWNYVCRITALAEGELDLKDACWG